MTLQETIEAALELSEIIINITNAPDLTYHEKHELIDLYLAGTPAESETPPLVAERPQDRNGKRQAANIYSIA